MKTELPERLGGPSLCIFGIHHPEELDDWEPDLAVRLLVELYHGTVSASGDVAYLTRTQRRCNLLADGEVCKESFPEGSYVGKRKRTPEMCPLVAAVSDEDARDAVEVRPADLRDEARPDRLPNELSLELRILLTAPGKYLHYPRVRTLDGLLDR